ncbi:hypothetical protein GCG54_00009054 [Colletotrichum gloeosporioides]|uniref:Nephrocystin 3-like N-terminal domain-containing protein n=1 Tax=Colletotrichum gloeosporioides TaxID=474922 RepID=A0A8H8WNG9_COLGL|nr:uncharacterized protein GCG54_00009054 [Colletotrichum gloeosporioides]KAF3797085.1 hypothetical protein GCG54_00009054 [Colletotrichum gloeosporioides]
MTQSIRPVRRKQDTTQEAAPIRKGSEGNIRELWDLVCGALRDEDEQLIVDFEKKIEGDLSAGLSKTAGFRTTKRDWMDSILTRKMEQVNRDSWKLKFGSSKILVKDVVKPILGVVSWANDFISKAVRANPSASLAGGGVSLLPPEDLYERYSESETGGPSQITYRSAPTTLYHHVPKFQITSYCYYARSTAYRLGLDSVRWHEWEDLLEKTKEQERVFSAVLDRCRDVRYEEECFTAKRRHEQLVSCWQNIGTDVSGLLSAVREAQREGKRMELLQWLCAVDTSALYNAARDKHQAGTCSWLLEDSKDFKTWMESPKSLLWLSGKPGSGKSILSSSVIKHLQDNCRSDPGTALAYFYFSFGSLEQQSVAIMLSSLVKQLCASRPDTPQAINNFENYKIKGERPDTKTLEEALIAATRTFSDVFIVIDALDECPILNRERKKLLASLTRIAAAMPDNLHLFCTSRAEPDISTTFNKLLSSPCGTEINLTEDTTGVHNDMSTYISSVLESDDYRSWPGELKADAKRLLIEKADGMFQYLVCQFEGLRNPRSNALISSALKNLPKGLDATYDRLLLSIEADFQAQILSLLKWLAFSNRPLELEELAEIFILHPERPVGVNIAERLFEPEDVLRYVSSLVTIQKQSTMWRRSGTKKYVRLAHFTVKEYLISSQISKGPAACYSFNENEAHLHISHCCLVYHLYKTDKIWIEGGSLWKITQLASGDGILKCLREILKTGMQGQESFYCEYAQARANHYLRRSYCYTAALGFLNLTDLLLSASSDTTDYLTQEDLDLILHDATLAGSLETVQFALDKGALVDAQNDIGESALQLAASRNQPEIVDLLLSCGADAYKSGCPLTSTLSSLSTRFCGSWGTIPEQLPNWTPLANYNRSLQLLIDNGADVNKQCDIHGTALSMAASIMGHHSTRYFVDFLLQRGASVNLPAGDFGSPLQAACSHMIAYSFDQDKYESYNDVVMGLLKMGAEVNAQGGKYGNALQAASYAGNYAATMEPHCKQHVQLNIGKSRAACYSKREMGDSRSRRMIVHHLLEMNADVSAAGGNFGSALQAASVSGDESGEAIASLLLSKGTEVNTQGVKYGTAVQGACAKGRIGVVRLLLAHGCDLNIEDGKYGTALQAACAWERSSTWALNTELVGLLIEHGADIDEESPSANDALKMLLTHGVDVNDSRGRMHGTALQAAIHCSQDPELTIQRVRFLIGHGANINAGGGPYGFSLQSAFMIPYNERFMGSEVPFSLLDSCPGIDIGVTGGKFGTALQAAAYYGYIDAIRRILGNDGYHDFDSDDDGAGPNAKVKLVNIRGGEYGSALDAAVYARGGKYGSALNAAVVKGYWDLVEILLKSGAKSDCHDLMEPDEEWLKWVEREDGSGAVGRYRKFWEKQKPKSEEARSGEEKTV